MSNLSVNYMGLELTSPIIASSCGLTSKPEQIKALSEAGVGAIVLKSIFEEQIMSETASLDSSSYTEESEYLYHYIKQNTLAKYMSLITEAKSVSKAPIIASVNCMRGGDWVQYAKDIQAAGADAIELNIYLVPTSYKETAQSLEKEYLDTVAKIVESLTIPVSVKLTSSFTNPINIVNELYLRGAKAVVLFNRFYEPDIDIETLEIKQGSILTQAGEARNLQRTIALMTSEVKGINVAATTGVVSGADAVKMILCGAIAVEVCSVLYEKGVSAVTELNNFISEYMERNTYSKVSDFCGVMNKQNCLSSHEYMRSQFMKYYGGYGQ
ncbi:MAG: dihydroorotate dehydrogenase-like protein [Rikenellaceae bacterium]